MGIVYIGFLLGWALLALLIGALSSLLLRRFSRFAAIEGRYLRNTIACVVGFSPFLYWRLRIYSFGGLWADECEKRTAYVLHASPPLDLVAGPGSITSRTVSSWLRLGNTDIRSLVTEDRKGRGLTGEDGEFALTLSEHGDPRCEPFEKWKGKRETSYLQGRCVAIEPLDATAEVTTLESVSGGSKILHESEPLTVREHRTLLRNAGTQEVYAEYVEVSYNRPYITDNFFVLLGWPPSCKKLEVLEKNNLHGRLFQFAFSEQFRQELENIMSDLQ